MNRALRLTLLLSVFLLAWAVSLIVTMPADIAWGLVRERVPTQAYGLHGNIWDGGATAIVLRGHGVSDIHWTLQPAALLSRQLAVTARASTETGKLDGRITITAQRRITIQAGHGNIDIDTLLAWIRRAGLGMAVDGRLDAVIRSLVIAGGRLRQADALITWEDASLRLGQPHALGDITLRLSPGDSGNTRGELHNEGGPLSLNGKLTVAPDGAFEANLKVSPRAEQSGAGPRLSRSLGLVNPDGTTVIEASGNLDGRGLNLTQHPG